MYFKITGNDHIFYQNITFSKNKFEIFNFKARRKANMLIY